MMRTTTTHRITILAALALAWVLGYAAARRHSAHGPSLTLPSPN